MYGHLLILCTVILVSCNEVKKDYFFPKTNKRWFAAHKIEKINDNYEDLSDIDKPRGTIQPLLKIHYYQSDFKSVSDCLFYRVATLNDGVISVVENPKNLDCKELFLTLPYAKQVEIQNFGITINGDVLKLNIDKKSFEYKLFNIPKPRIEKVLNSSNEVSILFASPVQTKVVPNFLNNGSLCKVVEDDCSVTLNECSRCRGASYFIINSKCYKGFSRVCGIDHCGQKNKPACIRGVQTSEMDMSFYCVNDSPVGFCNEGLRVVCINGTLECE